ncbi:MAG TPA: metalloregulator ArsR/SmtB family transcription factor [Euzebyales bacterium]|nr:metalloregulator ArsR/SmtB family transcription factor [Euzebyales bacterium]
MTTTDERVTADCCVPLLDAPITETDAQQMAQLFKALADPARLRLLSLIAARPAGEACNCDLVEPVGLSQPTVSHHLKVLHDSGLLDRERRGQWVYYRVRRDQLEMMRSALA